MQYLVRQDGTLRDRRWHEDHLENLTRFILELADYADSVPEWLATHQDYKPQRLISQKLI